jgi:diguanylate cyclase (GGDEF)-like protein
VEAAAAAERLRLVVQSIEFDTLTGVRAQLTVSIGVACTSVGTAAPEILLEEADAALYDAKRNGRNRVELARSAQVT